MPVSVPASEVKRVAARQVAGAPTIALIALSVAAALIVFLTVHGSDIKAL
jgi:hypothetical protein